MATQEMAVTGGRRRSLAPLGKLTLFSLLGIGAVVVLGGLLLSGEVDQFSLIVAGITLVPALLVATGWRWTPAVAALLSSLLLLLAAFFLSPVLARPQDPEFPLAVLLITLPLLAVVGGIGSTIQNYRRASSRLMPRWMRVGLIALAGFVVGAIAVGLIPEQGQIAGVSPELLNGLPDVTTRDFSFSQRTVRVTAGEMVALKLVNEDSSGHSFDIDELDIHVPMSRDRPGLAVLRPEEPGTYTFYCGVPGHADLEAGTGMIGTIIVDAAESSS